MTPTRLERLYRLSAWWSGAAIARGQLALQATSDTERDAHLRLITEYEARAKAAGMVS